MRLITTLLTLAALALAALAGHQLWQVLSTPEQQTAQLTFGSDSDTEPATPRPRLAHRWPPLFGEKQPPRSPAQKAPQPPEPQPPKPPMPPLGSLGYVLKGRVQAGSATWAIVAHPSGEQLVRDGDSLRADIKVTRIDADGLWISRQGGAPELLGFED